MKGKSQPEVELKYMQPSQISKIHKANGDALDDSVDGLEAKKANLKEKIKELETVLMPLRIFASPLTMIKSTTPDIKFKGSSFFLTLV
jgi:hypothetical protein